MKKKTDTPDPGSDNGNAGTTPIENKQEVQQSNDEHIDQDFPGYPYHPSTEKEIEKKKDTPTGI